MRKSSHAFLRHELPEGWQVMTVDDIKSPEKHSCVAGPFGSSISAKYFVEHGVPIIRGSNLSLGMDRFIANGFAFISEETASKFSAQTVTADDVVFTCWGTIGQVGIIPRDGPYDRYVISNKQLKLRVDRERIDPLFAYYHFASDKMVEYIKGRAIGAAVPGINLGILKALPVLLPPMETQKRILLILGTYDELIKVNRRRVAVLEEMARRLFEEWFVRFRFPGHENVPLVDTPDGLWPEGWRMGTLDDLVLHRRETTQPGAHLRGRAYVPIECIGRRTWALDGVRPWNEAQSSLQLFDRGDILFGAMRAYFHKVAPAPVNGVTRSTCFVLRPRDQRLAAYALLTLFRDDTVAYAAANSKGSTIPYAQWGGVLERLKCPIPDWGTLERFQAVVAPMIDLAMGSWSMNEKLTASRDLLLPRLMSGQLSVSAAEKELEAA